MLSLRPTPRRTLGIVLATGIATCALARPAGAHFILQSPPAWMSQDVGGFPEKLGPCGDEGGGTATDIVTAYQAGTTLTVTIDEVVPHPGHYRFALAVHDRSELPAEPAVTMGSQACGTAAIENPPVFPVLADDVFDHTSPFTSPQTTQITLPSNITCTHCTLQVIEFMSDHGLNMPGGCFYHHCADISIQTGPVDAGAPAPDGASSSDADGSATGGSGGVGGSGGSGGADTAGSSAGCSASGRTAPGTLGLGGLLVLAATLARSRRRR